MALPCLLRRLLTNTTAVRRRCAPAPPQETQRITFALPSREFMGADLVNCRAMEPKTNMQNRVASFERVIKADEEHKRTTGRAGRTGEDGVSHGSKRASGVGWGWRELQKK